MKSSNKNIILFLVLFFAASSVYSQFDSLLKATKNTKTPIPKKIEALLNLSRSYIYFNSDSAVLMANQAIQLATKINSEKYLGDAYRRLGTDYNVLSDSANAFKNLYLGLKYSQKARDTLGISTAYLNIGNMFDRLSIYTKAVENSMLSAEYSAKINDKIGVAYAYGNIGAIYHKTTNYPRALEFQYKCLKVAESLGDQELVANTLNNISMVYKALAEYDKAIDCLNKSADYYLKIGNKLNYANVLGNLGNLYENKNQHDKALDCQLKSLSIRQEIDDQNGLGDAYNNIGYIYLAMNKPDSAIANLMKGLKIFESINSQDGVAITKGVLGDAYFQLRDYKNAIKYENEAVEIGESIGELGLQKNSYFSLYNIYKSKNDYKNSLNFYETFILLRDSITNDENHKEINKREIQYEYDKKASADSIRTAEEKRVTDAEIAAQNSKLKQERTQRYALYGGLLLVIVFSGFMYNRFTVTRKQKNIIEEQKSLVEQQKSEVEQQKHLIEEKSKEITDSINYAQNIQLALVPSEDEFRNYFPHSYVLFKPKDIVSGDFYWALEKGDHVFFAMADCTGHGVPGAFMSMLGMSFLDEIINEKKIYNPADALDMLRIKIIVSLNKTNTGNQRKDGMDIVLCAFNKQNNILNFAAANNALYHIRNKEIVEHKGDKQPVGMYSGDVIQYRLQTIQIQKGDSICLTTDGYPDQFGGPKGKKFKYKQFEDKLLEIGELACTDKKKIMHDTIVNWMGNLEQVDDISVMGIKF